MDECAIVGFGLAEASLEGIAQLRRDPGPGRPKALEFQVLKHADEHTVLALAAMLNGLEAFPADYPFGDWGVVAAPRWPGRLGTAHAIERYRADGPRGVSPMAIPNVCLHCVSGTVSLAFQMRGPNFGVGGGLASVADGLLAGLVVQLEQQPPGLWVLFSEWNIEPGQVSADVSPRAAALALALQPIEQAPLARRLALRPKGAKGERETASSLPPNPYPRIVSLIDYLRRPDTATMTWTCLLDWGMELVVLPGGSKA
jgi:hypothetical protein